MDEKRALIFEAGRDGYSVDQVKDRAMTVGELKRILEDYDDDDLIILMHDRGYTYGSLDDDYQEAYSSDGWKHENRYSDMD